MGEAFLNPEVNLKRHRYKLPTELWIQHGSLCCPSGVWDWFFGFQNSKTLGVAKMQDLSHFQFFLDFFQKPQTTWVVRIVEQCCKKLYVSKVWLDIPETIFLKCNIVTSGWASIGCGILPNFPPGCHSGCPCWRGSAWGPPPGCRNAWWDSTREHVHVDIMWAIGF